jgi:hypothetical protein
MKQKVNCPKTTDKDLAIKYRSDPRTIRRWRAEGAPLKDPGAMGDWLAQRRSLPPGTADAGVDVLGPGAKLQDAKIQKTILECKRLAHALAVEQGKFTANDQVYNDFTKAAAATRAELLRLKADAPTWSGLPEAEIERRLDAFINEACAHLSDLSSYKN